MLAVVDGDDRHRSRPVPASCSRVPIDTGLPVATGDELISVLRELLSNVARHAQASEVEVHLTVDDAVSLLVDDDGVGPPEPAADRQGMGLRNLAKRADRLGGRFTLSPRPGGGSRAAWRVPRLP